MSARDCLDEDRLIDFVMGEVTGGEAAGIEEHIRRCPACRGRVESLRRTLDLAAMDRVPEPVPAYWEHFAAGVRHRIRSRAESRKRRIRLILIPGLATAAASVLIVLMLARGPVEPVVDVEAVVAEINTSAVAEEVLVEAAVDALLVAQFGEEADLLDNYLIETGDVAEIVTELDDEEERELINKLATIMESRGSAETIAGKECWS